MNLTQFYALPSIISTTDISSIIHPHLDLFPELAVNGSFNTRSIDNIRMYNTRVTFRIVARKTYSADRYGDRRVWILASIWLDDEPFLIVRNPTDQVDAYPNLLIPEGAYKAYRIAVTYLWSLLEPDVEKSPFEYQPLSGTVTPHALNLVPVPEYSTDYIEKVINYTLLYNRFDMDNNL